MSKRELFHIACTEPDPVKALAAVKEYCHRTWYPTIEDQLDWIEEEMTRTPPTPQGDEGVIS